MSTARPAKRWAKPEDWERVKPFIKELYKDEMQPLKEVMSVMEKKYDFHAT